MAITRVQGPKRVASVVAAAQDVTLDSTPVEGNILIAMIGTGGSDAAHHGAVQSIAQAGVNWSTGGAGLQKYSLYAAANFSSEIWLGIVGSGASATATVTLAKVSDWLYAINLLEYSGIALTNFLDKTASTYAWANPTSTGTTATTTQANELWIGVIASDDFEGPQSTPQNGFTLIDGTMTDPWSGSLAGLEKIVSSTGTASSGTTQTGPDIIGYAGCIATFKAVAPLGILDAGSFSDQITRRLTINRYLIDGYSLSDIVQERKNNREVLTDGSKLADVFGQQRNLARSLTDRYNFRDGSTGSAFPLEKRVLRRTISTNAMSLYDASSRLRVATATLREAFYLSDQITRQMVLARMLTEGLFLEDNWLRHNPSAMNVFNEGFENGFGTWNLAGTPTLVTSPVHHGKYALHSGTLGDGVWRNLGADYADLFVRVYAYFEAGSLPTAGNDSTIVHIADSDFGNLVVAGVSNYFGLCWELEAGGNTYFGGTLGDVHEGQWYCIEAERNSTTGAYNLWVDGVNVISGTAVITNAGQLVILGSKAGYDIDCAVVDDAYIGPESQNPSFQMTMARYFSDGYTLNDLLAQKRSLSRTVPTDAISLYDILSRLRAGSLSLQDSMRLTDILSTQRTLARFMSDGYSLYDTLSASAGRRQILSDSSTLSDALSQRRSLARYLTEAATLYDSLTSLHAHLSTLSIIDAAVLTDILTHRRTLSRYISEAITLHDSLSTIRAHPNTLSVTDASKLTDMLSHSRTLSRYVVDAAAIYDALSRFRAGRLSVQDNMALADIFLTRRTLARFVTDPFVLHDDLAKLRGARQSITEGLTLYDQWSPRSTLVRFLSEPFKLADGAYGKALNGIVGWWRFDEGAGTIAYDSSGNGNNGALLPLGSEPTWVVGRYATALNFQGGYVSLGNTPSPLQMGTNDFTVVFLVNGPATASYSGMVGNSGAKGYRTYRDGGSPTKIRWALRGDIVKANTQTQTVFDSLWHHCIWIVDRANNKVTWYIDGTKDATTTDITGLGNITTTSDFSFGRYDSLFNGIIDEVQIYDHALSSDEALALHNYALLTFQMAHSMPISDYATLADTFSKLRAGRLTVQEAMILADVLSTQRTLRRTMGTDGFSLSDILSLLRAGRLSLADYLSFYDALSVSRGRGWNILDRFTLSDSLTHRRTLARFIVDAAYLHDEFSTGGAGHRLIYLSDYLNLADAITTQMSLFRSLTEDYTLADSLIMQRAISRTLTTDSFLLADSTLLQRTMSRTITDPLILGDSLLFKRALRRAVTDASYLTDKFSSLRAGRLSIQESSKLFDSLATQRALNRLVLDALSLADRPLLSGARRFLLTEGLYLADTFTQRRDLFRSIIDGHLLSDKTSTLTGRRLLLTDAQSLVDTLDYFRQHMVLLNLSEGLTLHETLYVSTLVLRILLLSEGYTLTESINYSRNLAMLITDAIKMGETPTIAGILRLWLSEGHILSDINNVVPFKILTILLQEGFTFAEGPSQPILVQVLRAIAKSLATSEGQYKEELINQRIDYASEGQYEEGI